MEFHPQDDEAARKRLCKLNQRSAIAAAQCDVVSELAKQVFVKCHVVPDVHYKKTQIW